MRFDRDMRELGSVDQAPLVMLGIARHTGYQSYDRGISSWAHAPHMEIADPVAVRLKRSTNIVRKSFVSGSVEQDSTGIVHQAPRPASNHHRSDEAGEWVQPGHARRHPSDQKSDNRKNRGHRIGQDVQIGGTKIVIGMTVGMLIMVMVVRSIRQQPGTH